MSAIRGEIVGPGRTTYLNTGGLGLMPRATRRHLQEEYDAVGSRTAPMASYLGCLARSGGLRERIARFVGALADEIALKTGVADGYGTVLGGREWHEGDEIPMTPEEHPTPRLAVELAARRFGLQVRVVPLRASGGAFVAELTSCPAPHTRLIAMSQITTDSGACLPAKQISEITSRAGVLTLFDGAHAVGQVPLDLHALGCDVFASMGYKWALGPMCSGFLYVRREHQGLLRPVVGGGGLDWRELAAGGTSSAGTAARFEFAWRAWPGYFALGRSLKFLESVGVLGIHRYTHQLSKHLRQRLGEIPGIRIHTPGAPGPSTGILAFNLAGMGPRELLRALRERWNIVQRPAMMVGTAGGVWVSPALFTWADEAERLVEAVRGSPGNAAECPAT